MSLNGTAHTFSIIYVTPFDDRLGLEYDVKRRFSLLKRTFSENGGVIVYTLVWVAIKGKQTIENDGNIGTTDLCNCLCVVRETNVNGHVFTERVLKTVFQKTLLSN